MFLLNHPYVWGHMSNLFSFYICFILLGEVGVSEECNSLVWDDDDDDDDDDDHDDGYMLYEIGCSVRYM